MPANNRYAYVAAALRNLVLALVLLCATPPLCATAAPWNTRHITMADGLPTNTVRCIVQDQDGFLWFGTDMGLCRYDGYGVHLFRNPALGADQYVCSLALCGGRLYVGSSHGAFVFDTAKGTFTPLGATLNALVRDITPDGDGGVWLATEGQGVFRYHPASRQLTRYALPKAHDNAAAVFVDNTNQVWALTRHARGLYHLNRQRKAFDQVELKGLKAKLDGMCLGQGPDATLLIGTWNNGLLAMRRDGSVEQLVDPSVTGMGTHIHTIYTEPSGAVFIGCEEGLLRYDTQQRTHTVVMGADATPSGQFVYAVTRDREDGLWVGTFYGGVIYLSPLGERFATFTPDGTLLRGRVTSRFCEQDGKRVWVGSDDGGLSCYDIGAGRFTTYPGQAVMQGKNVHGLWAEGETLWVGTYGNGIIRMNTATGEAKTYLLDGERRATSCYALARDSRGRLWATSMDNANVYDAKADAFRSVKDFGRLTVDIQEDRQGNVWFATQGGGLWRLSPKGQWAHYTHANSALGSDNANSMRLDAQGRLLVATDDGLYEYRHKGDTFSRVPVPCKDQAFVGMALNNSEIWLTTATALVRYAPGEATQYYNRADGLLGGMHRPNACMMASDGRVWIGGVDGINAFYPYQIKTNTQAPPVFVTGFFFPGHADEAMDSLAGVLSHTSGVEVEYSENMFSIQFAALSYVSPEKNRYQYKLSGFDEQWIDAGTDHRVTYTNLPPGTYTFMLRGCNNDGVWCQQPATLKIVIRPPFYWSLPAKVFYVLLAALLLWYYIHLRLRRAEHRHQRELREVNERNERELRDARLRFFTMIAHEIRTPVSLIIGPIEKLKEQWGRVVKAGDNTAEADATIDVIDRNAHRLLDLVNQLLDYNKVKQQGMRLRFRLCNVAELMRAVAVRFEPTLAQKGITLTVDYPDPSFSVVADGEAVTKILSNFMTNASKYTKTSIRMGCKAGGATFSLSVADDGIGVDKADQQKIFEAFYQARDNKPGTGIGLNTVKMLAEAHHGSVGVESEPGHGSVFTVTLPVRQDVAVGEDDAPVVTDEAEGIIINNVSANGDDAATAEAAGTADATTPDDKKTCVLVVEDDDDLRNFIAADLADHYDVLTAASGTDALPLLRDHNVGIVVSDWMMPGMDGADLCRTIRNNPHTSHTIFVMLTAKTDDESKAEGMDIGADAFIEKPFSMKYLRACVANLLSRRRLLMERFANNPSEPIATIAPTPTDNKFLTKLNDLIEANIDNPQLSVNFLADQLRMSRSGLFAKIKAITDVTPNEMIQVVRLRRAAQLLDAGEHSVSEVAFMVGFNSSSYFAKCFQKQFGVKPSEYRS